MAHRSRLVFPLLFLLFIGTASGQKDEELRFRTKETGRSVYARPQNFGIGANLGLNWLNCDVQNNGTFFINAKTPVGFGGDVRVAYTFLRMGRIAAVNAFGSAGIHMLSASAEYMASTNWGPYKVETSVLNLTAGAESQFFPRSKLRPFVFVGLGFTSFDPNRTIDERNYNYGDGIYQYLKDEKSALAMPLGLGLVYTASEIIDISLAFSKTYTFTDNLDGWTVNINDNYPFASVGVMLYFGGKREEKPKYVPPPPPVVTDTDGDGLLDTEEQTTYKTDPKNRDTDGDGLTDGDEVKIYKTDPLNKDTDGDRLADGEEVTRYRTDPLKKDTDGDGCIDGDEVLDMRTDPLKTDTDGDELTDCDERNIYRTNPLVMDTDGDGVNDGKEIKTGTDPLKADVFKVETGAKIVLEGINFETNKATILPESEEILMRAYQTMRTNPTLRVEISGHTDDVGSDASNQKLSERRANAVRDWLVNKGIDGSRIQTKGYGEKQPTVPNTSPENRAKNRRIEFKIISM
ncbi:MAG: DUF6089 family protein [Bacteroidota bacterium]|nr:DUF6089 family protein [Bacteroidota bacterium]